MSRNHAALLEVVTQAVPTSDAIIFGHPGASPTASHNTAV